MDAREACGGTSQGGVARGVADQRGPRVRRRHASGDERDPDEEAGIRETRRRCNEAWKCTGTLSVVGRPPRMYRRDDGEVAYEIAARACCRADARQMAANVGPPSLRRTIRWRRVAGREQPGSNILQAHTFRTAAKCAVVAVPRQRGAAAPASNWRSTSIGITRSRPASGGHRKREELFQFRRTDTHRPCSKVVHDGISYHRLRFVEPGAAVHRLHTPSWCSAFSIDGVERGCPQKRRFDACDRIEKACCQG